jgi:hypothetical protein
MLHVLHRWRLFLNHSIGSIGSVGSIGRCMWICSLDALVRHRCGSQRRCRTGRICGGLSRH